MAEVKKKKAATPGFLIGKGEMNGTEIGIRFGRSVLRNGTILGMGYLTNGTNLRAKKIRKWMGPIAMVLGTVAESVLSEKSAAGRITCGLAQGINTWGTLDSAATFIFPSKKGDFGLAGLGATYVRSTDDTPRTAEGVDWAEINRQLNYAQPEASATGAGMSGMPQGSGGGSDSTYGAVVSKL